MTARTTTTTTAAGTTADGISVTMHAVVGASTPASLACRTLAAAYATGAAHAATVGNTARAEMLADLCLDYTALADLAARLHGGIDGSN